MTYDYDEEELHERFEDQSKRLRKLIHSSKNHGESISELQNELDALQRDIRSDSDTKRESGA